MVLKAARSKKLIILCLFKGARKNMATSPKKASRVSPLITALSWVLIVQIGLGSTLYSSAVAHAAGSGSDDHSSPSTILDQINSDGSRDPLTAAGRQETEKFISELESSSDTEFPRNTPDTFHLTGQKLEILEFGPERGSHDLSSLRVGLPSIVADFDREVSIEVNRATKELSIVYTKNGEARAKHTLTGFDVVSYARDVEMLQFVDASGKMYVLDMVYARGAAFNSPLPVFELGSLPEGALARGKINVEFVTRGIQPPEVIPESAVVPRDVSSRRIWTAGDFMVSFKNAEGKKELIGVYNRGVSQMQMYTGNAVVAFLATMVSPPEQEAMTAAAASALADAQVAADARDAAGSMDALTRGALAAVPDTALPKLMGRSASNRTRATVQRDRFTTDEWADHFETLRSRAVQEQAAISPSQQVRNGSRYFQLGEQIESSNFSSEWQKVVTDAIGAKQVKRSLFYRVMTHKAMKFLAAITGGYLALHGVGGLVGMNITPDMARPLAWAIHSANWLYGHVWPEVLKNSAYRVTLFKSFFALSAFIPALQVVGTLYGGPRGWSAIKAKAALGIRAYALFQLPFWIRLARVAQQPTLMPALQMGINPFERVRQDSELGRRLGLTEDVRPGLVLSRGDARVAEVALKRRVLEELATQRNRVKAYSYLLANIVVGERYGIDPATMLMARGGRVADASVTELLNDPAFAREWLQVAHELAQTLSDMKSGALVADITEIKAEDLKADYDAARRLAETIKSRTRIQSAIATLKSHWREFGTRFAKGFGRYGLAENDFLSKVEPSDSVSSASWQQFFTDYVMTVFQMGVVGERADFTKPDKLAADPHGILFTNKGHFTDMVDQAVRAYGMGNPSDLALVFQRDAQPTENVYDPIEVQTAVGEARVDTFAHGMLQWCRNALNLREANYGAVFMKSLKKRFMTIQAPFTLSMMARMGLAGQGFVQAITGYGYLFFLGMPAYAWPWMPISQGNDTYEEQAKVSDHEFLSAKAKIAQGLRLNDAATTNDGYEALSAIYSKHSGGDLPRNLREGLIAAEDFLKIPAAERISASQMIKNFYGQAARLKLAIESGDQEKIAESYEQVRAQYGTGEASEAMKALNARSLLEVAMKTPPFANKAHPMVTWTWTYIGSIATTYLASAVFATSYGSGMSPTIFLSAVFLSAKFYLGTYFGQKLINTLGARLDAIRDHDRAARAAEAREASGEPRPEVRPSAPQSYAEYRRKYVEDRAREFRVDVRDVEATMDATMESALRGRFEAEMKKMDCQALLTTPEAVKPYTLGQKIRILLRGAH